MVAGSQGQSGSSLPQAASGLRRLVRKAADSARVAFGKETKAGVAEANALEQSITSASRGKNKPSVLHKDVPEAGQDKDMAQMRQQMAALGSVKHIKNLQEHLSQPVKEASTSSDLKTLPGKRLGNRRNGMVVNKEDTASLNKQLDTRRNGLVASAEFKTQIDAALASTPRNPIRQFSNESWRSGDSNASTLKGPQHSPTTEHDGTADKIHKIVAKGSAKVVDIAARNDRSRARIVGR